MAKKRRPVSAQAKRRIIVFGPICIIIVLYFFFSFFSNINDIRILKQQKKDLESQYVSLQEDADNLKTEINKLKDPEYLAKYARENYGYSKNGEYIIKLENSDEEQKKGNSKIEHYQFLMYISGGVVGFIFIYIFIKGLRKNKK